MKQFLLSCLCCFALLSMTNLCSGQGAAVYPVTPPVLSASGAFAGTLLTNGSYGSPYFSTSRTISNTVTADTMNQKINYASNSVTVQFTYTKTSGSPSGVVTTEVSCDTGTATGYYTLYTDSVKNQVGTQTYSHPFTGWPYSNVRMRYAGTSAPNSGTWRGTIIVRYKREEDWELP